MELPDIVFKKADYVETASGNKVCRQTVLCGSQNIILQGKTIVQTDAIIRGDLANVRVGRYSIISNRAVIRPPFKKFSKGKYIFELSMAEYIDAAIFLQGIHTLISGRPRSLFIRFDELPNYLKSMEELCNWRSKPCFFPRAAIAVAFFPIHIGEHTFVGEGSVVSAAVVGSYVYIGKNCVIGRRCVLKDCCMVMDNTVLPPEAVVPSFTKWSGSPGRLDPSGDLPECTQDMMANFTHSYYDHFIPEKPIQAD